MTWRTATLGDLFDLKYGKALPERNRVLNGLTPVYGSNGVVGKHNSAITAGPTIVVGRKGSAGRVAYCETPCWPIDTTYFIDDFGDAHDPRFWAYQFQCLRLDELEKSSAIPGLSRDDVYTKVCSYPDNVDEQRRIANGLDHIATRLDEAQIRLDAIPTILKRFRMSVLAAACSGRLTADWRNRHPTEPALALLNKIKAARLVAATRESERHKIMEFLDTFREQEGDGSSTPTTWLECFIGSVGNVSNGSTPSRKEPSYWEGRIPWVSSGEVRNCRISVTREAITPLGYANSSVRLLPRGSVLIAMIGEGKTRGQSAILEIEACTNQNVAAVIIDHGLVEPAYLWYWFQGRYESNREAGSGSGPQALNCQRVRELPLNLPPLAEQTEIVRRIGDLFAQADAIDERYRKAKIFTDKLMPSVLAKAFRRELVESGNEYQ